MQEELVWLKLQEYEVSTVDLELVTQGGSLTSEYVKEHFRKDEKIPNYLKKYEKLRVSENRGLITTKFIVEALLPAKYETFLTLKK